MCVYDGRILPPVETPAIFGIGNNYITPPFGNNSPGPTHMPVQPDSGNIRMYALAAHGAPIQLPTDGKPVQFWGQLAVIIGTKCENVSEKDALSYIGAYSCANEVSTGVCALGPVMLMPDDDGPTRTHWLNHVDPQSLCVKTTLNGQAVMESHTSQMLLSVTQLISLFSKTHTLHPGTVVLTGTPNPTGAPACLNLKDRASVRVETIGVLSNHVVEQLRRTPDEFRADQLNYRCVPAAS